MFRVSTNKKMLAAGAVGYALLVVPPVVDAALRGGIGKLSHEKETAAKRRVQSTSSAELEPTNGSDSVDSLSQHGIYMFDGGDSSDGGAVEDTIDVDFSEMATDINPDSGDEDYTINYALLYDEEPDDLWSDSASNVYVTAFAGALKQKGDALGVGMLGICEGDW